jgi:hypothetical protein
MSDTERPQWQRTALQCAGHFVFLIAGAYLMHAWDERAARQERHNHALIGAIHSEQVASLKLAHETDPEVRARLEVARDNAHKLQEFWRSQGAALRTSERARRARPPGPIEWLFSQLEWQLDL